MPRLLARIDAPTLQTERTMRPNSRNPQLWFAWYPVWTSLGPRWLTEVWWWVETPLRADGRGIYSTYENHYEAR